MVDPGPAFSWNEATEVPARSGDRDDLGQGCEVPHAMPRSEIENGIGSRDEEELDVAEARAHRLQRLYREGRTFAVELDAGDRELLVGRGCQGRHEIAIFGIGEPCLLPRPPRRNQSDPLE
jgi:hypothetical protein